MTTRRIGGSDVLDRLEEVAAALALHHGLEIFFILLGVHLVVGRDEVEKNIIFATRRQNSTNDLLVRARVDQIFDFCSNM